MPRQRTQYRRRTYDFPDDFPERLKYPDLATREPAPDDEEIFGEAWPLIVEWREARPERYSKNDAPHKGLGNRPRPCCYWGVQEMDFGNRGSRVGNS